jgi:hypothetical protein
MQTIALDTLLGAEKKKWTWRVGEYAAACRFSLDLIHYMIHY